MIDLAIYMCGPQANEGILSFEEDGEPDLRPLHEGGSEVWVFIKKTREKAWDKAGLDPSVLSCPKNADDIFFDEPISKANEEPPLGNIPPDESMMNFWSQQGDAWSDFFDDTNLDTTFRVGPYAYSYQSIL